MIYPLNRVNLLADHIKKENIMASIKEYLELREALHTAYNYAKHTQNERDERYRASLILLLMSTEYRIRELSRIGDKTLI